MEKVLPKHLEIIFSYLRPKDIENAADVCRGWREIIVSSTPLIQSLTLSINFPKKIEETLLKLPYRNFDLDDHFASHNYSKVRHFLQTVDRGLFEKLRINVRLEHLPLAEFLTGTPLQNLTTLVVEELPGYISGDIKLPNLTHLKLKDYGLELLSKIKIHKVKFLYLSSRESEWNQYSNDFETFLMTCGELKHLIFGGFSPLLSPKLNIQLESLKMLGLRKLGMNFKPFFESQQATIKYLQIDVDESDDEVWDFIYHEMNLEKLIDRRMKRGEMKELKDVKIKNIALNYAQNDSTFIQRLLPYCHDLEVLNINLLRGNEIELLRMLSQLPKLKYLKLRDWTYDCDRIEIDLQFPQLEELILPDGRVKSIVCGCPKMKRLKISDTLTLSEFERIFESCPDIEEIDLGVLFRLTDEMLKAFKFAGSKIKLKCRVTKVDEDHYEKLARLKNRLIVNFNTIDPWEGDTYQFSKLLTESYGDIDECMNRRSSSNSLYWKEYDYNSGYDYKHKYGDESSFGS